MGAAQAMTAIVGRTEEGVDNPQTERDTENTNEEEHVRFLVNSRQPYQTHPIRRQGERKPDAIATYDASDRWRLCMSVDEWIMGEMGPKVWLTTIYLRAKEGEGPIKGTTEMGGVDGREAEEDRIRKGISLERRYWIATCPFMRCRWISPFDLYDALMRADQRKMDLPNLNENTQRLIEIRSEPNERDGVILSFRRALRL